MHSPDSMPSPSENKEGERQDAIKKILEAASRRWFYGNKSDEAKLSEDRVKAAEFETLKEQSDDQFIEAQHVYADKFGGAYEYSRTPAQIEAHIKEMGLHGAPRE